MGRWRDFRNVYQHGKENSTGINLNPQYIQHAPTVIENIIQFEERNEDETLRTRVALPRPLSLSKFRAELRGKPLENRDGGSRC